MINDCGTPDMTSIIWFSKVSYGFSLTESDRLIMKRTKIIVVLLHQFYQIFQEEDRQRYLIKTISTKTCEYSINNNVLTWRYGFIPFDAREAPCTFNPYVYHGYLGYGTSWYVRQAPKTPTGGSYVEHMHSFRTRTIQPYANISPIRE